MKKDIKSYIKASSSCQINKVQRKTVTSTSKNPFERLAIDIVGRLPITESRNRFILTM